MIVISIPPQLSRQAGSVVFRVRLAIDNYDFLGGRGFDVVSLKAKEKSAVLKPCTSIIDIVEFRAGHPRPQIADFLDEIAKTSCEVAGIANADCLLIPEQNWPSI